MKRELKFRALVNGRSEMIEWENLISLRNAINSEDGVVMQYIGLKDKNGKEIYEGDIVRINDNEIGGSFVHGIYEVKYYLPDCGFFLENEMKSINFNECYEYEVIGNVCETPEFLETK